MSDDTLPRTPPLSRDTAEDGTVRRDVPPGALSTSDRFALGAEIGRGGMGRVVEAQDRTFNRTVAVKELLGDADGQARQRFLTEALVTASLEHAGVTPVYDRGEFPDGRPFYAMRRVEGRTLSAALAAAAALEDRLKLLPVLIQVAQTLAHAHRRGIVHRDLKPDNVLLGTDGEVFVLDWGIAKVRTMLTPDPSGPSPAASPGTLHGAILGTPAYMAPEQARGEVGLVDERTDVFALGAILHHVLTGAPPYQGSTTHELLVAAAQGKRATTALPGVPPELVAVAGKAMAFTPADRYRTARELAGALEAFVSTALTRRPSGWSAWATRALIAVAGLPIVAAVLATLVFAKFHLMGFAPLLVLTLTVGGLAMAALETVTAGRHRLAGLGLVVSLGTFALSLVGAGLGLVQVFGALARPEFVSNPEQYRGLLAQGVMESVSNLPYGTSLALLQAFVWALVLRGRGPR